MLWKQSFLQFHFTFSQYSNGDQCHSLFIFTADTCLRTVCACTQFVCWLHIFLRHNAKLLDVNGLE